MSFNSSLNDVDAILFNEFGEEAIYSGVKPCHVIIDQNVQSFDGHESSSATDRIEISFNLSEVSPVKGASVRTELRTYTLGDQVGNDGNIARFEAK